MKLLIAVAFFMITSTLLIAQNNIKTSLSDATVNISKSEISTSTTNNCNRNDAKLDGQEDQERKHPSRQEIMSQKIAFFSQELNLTQQEAEQFWPVYNESWHARGRARRETINNLNKLNEALEANPPVSDSQIQALSDAYLESFKKEGNLYIS
ncbi:MAG: hypothetical protein RR880_01875, partial [Bacteroidales bacterium]